MPTSPECSPTITERKKQNRIRYEISRRFGWAARTTAAIAFGLQSCRGIPPHQPGSEEISGARAENRSTAALTVEFPSEMTPSPSASETPLPSRTPRPSHTATPTETSHPSPSPTESERAGDVIVLNREKGSHGVAQVFANYREELMRYMDEHDGAYPTQKIPQYIFRRDDDPATQQTEAFDAGIAWTDAAGLRKEYGTKRGVPQANLADCLDLAFRPFLADWEDVDFWSFGPNTLRVLNTYADDSETPPVKKCGWQKDVIRPEDRALFSRLGLEQEIAK